MIESCIVSALKNLTVNESAVLLALLLEDEQSCISQLLEAETIC
jgi:hypothetical protein